jgi:23S rRNA (cytosine1962-C5)-methyltransferase
MFELILKPGREKSVKRRHPWIFSGAVERVTGEPESGETVGVVSHDGQPLAVAAWSPKSQIVARVWDWEFREIGPEFFAQRIARSLALRRDLLPGCDALRLAHGESDGLPGVVIDRYGEVVVLQLSSAGAMRWRDPIAEAVQSQASPRTIFERSDADVLALEGLEQRVAHLRGDPLPASVVVSEAGLSYRVDVAGGHKTGFYLDQRANRARVRSLASGREVLDCFCYTGGFALNALAGGARSVTAVDSSGPALAMLRANAELNGLQVPEAVEGDVFAVLRGLRDRARRFGLIVLDPPKFAPTAAHAERAARAYKDINLLAFKLLEPGGLLVTFSCSGGVDAALFQKIVAGAALDAGVDARVVERLGAGPDHPVALHFPEGDYLKGLVCRVG